MKYAVDEQERIGIDVLVHGEPERTDMVEYFGQKLEGFTFTDNGWVQSYGSRYVRPPIIHGEFCAAVVFLDLFVGGGGRERNGKKLNLNLDLFFQQQKKKLFLKR
jgi:hypothetical protein